MTRLIPDEATARRIGEQMTPAQAGCSFTVFSYEQTRSRLTLFGVEIVTIDANGTRQTETIVTQ